MGKIYKLIYPSTVLKIYTSLYSFFLEDKNT